MLMVMIVALLFNAVEVQGFFYGLDAGYDPGAAAMVDVLDSMVDVGVVDDLGVNIAGVDMGAAEIPLEGRFGYAIG